VTSNINVASKAGAGTTVGDRGAARDRPLVNEVIDEITAWNPREFIAAFQRWHHGDLSLAHLNDLTLLEAQSPLSMSRLAEALGISVASATGIVGRMEKRSLVRRQHGTEDRRVVLVHLAPGGQRVFGEIDSRRRRGLLKLLERLADDELEGLLRGHRALRAARASLHDERGRERASDPAT
jgi:DNA-binding MarR family transcriptional regulator